MQLLQETKRYRVDDETSAIKLIEKFKADAAQEGYEVKKSSYTMKTKKSKGEILDVWYVVDVTLSYEEV